MSPKDHDRSVAAISHMPHLVASALAAATPAEELSLASTGWLDTTRIAGGDPDLWRQILFENRSGVLKSLDKFEKVLIAFRQALERDQQEKLLQLLEAGKQRRDSLGN
jgi:prephenate dehydrogenase